jgi:transcriptional regulator with XRE-family HTH domain
MLRLKTVTPKQLRQELKRRVRRSSQAHIARDVGVKAPLISNVLAGKVLPCGKLLKWLGYERDIRYRRVA